MEREQLVGPRCGAEQLRCDALAVSGSTLYAGGYFTTAGGIPANYIAQWNGSSWSALGSGRNSPVQALAVSGGTVYAGGSLTGWRRAEPTYVAQWNGSSWSALGSGMNGFNSFVFALAVSGSTVYAGGDFTAAGGDTNARYIAQWNGSGWSALGSGMNGDVFALAVSGSTLYAGGGFTTAGGSAANEIAQWNGSSWSALGSGMQVAIYTASLCMRWRHRAARVCGRRFHDGGRLPTPITSRNGMGAVGRPSVRGCQAVNTAPLCMRWRCRAARCMRAVVSRMRAAARPITSRKWNGSSWSALGSGINNGVEALAVSGSTLYAGGGFTTAGGSAATNIAQWNGSSWSALGSGMNSGVFALAVSGSTLYAGGDFTTAGSDTNANHIGQWNGSSWSALGSRDE